MHNKEVKMTHLKKLSSIDPVRLVSAADASIVTFSTTM